MEVNYEKLLQDSNQIKNYIKADIAARPAEQLTHKVSLKKWSAVEVVEHLNKVYDVYLDNFQKAIDDAEELTEQANPQMRRTILGRLSIYANKPKGKKRRFKMKTFDFFRPAISPDTMHEVFETFLTKKNRFNDLIKLARTKNLKDSKIPTALGEKVKFYVPECFEFLLVHEQRHMIQIEEAINLSKL
ncbi:DinB family protein [Ekhidna sp.]|uniref:DinB family protein n=1 Tax=Ekhidna sp. TaxID=2608089 RepID=UPI003B5028A6